MASVWRGGAGLSRSRPPGIPKLLLPLVFLFQPVLLLLLLALNIRRIELLLKCAIMGVVYLLQDVESRAGLLALAGGHRHAALGVVVDHPLVLDQSEVRWGSRDLSPPIAAHLVPEDVLGRQERVLQDADEVDDGALLYPVPELETKVHNMVSNHGEGLYFTMITNLCVKFRFKLFPILVRGEDDRLGRHHLQLHAARLDLPVGHRDLGGETWQLARFGRRKE